MRNLKGKVSIIIPAYNEAGHIYSNLEETVRTFDDFGCDYEIIIVDDGSSDNTYEEALSFASRYNNVIVKKNRSNYGKGRALKYGCRFVNGDYVVFLDADMDLHPGQIQTFFDIMRLDEADIVIGSKRHPNSKLYYPIGRRIISSVYFFLVYLLFGLPIKDTQTGLKLFKYEALKEIFPKILIKKFAFDLELLINAHHLGYKIAQAPVVLTSRRKYGRIGLKAIYQIWWDTMAIFYRLHILKYYDKHNSRNFYSEKMQKKRLKNEGIYNYTAKK